MADLVHHGNPSFVYRSRPFRGGVDGQFACVAYGGGHSTYSQRILVQVVASFPDLRIAIVRNPWLKEAEGAILKSEVLSSPISDFSSRTVQGSRVGITACSALWGEDQGEDAVSTQAFEIPTRNGSMIQPNNAEVRDVGEPGREIRVCNDPDNLCQQVAYYLHRPTLRKEMIDRAYERAVHAYSYCARASEISELIIRRLFDGSET